MTALDNPLLDPNTPLKTMLKYYDIILTSFYGVEIMLKFFILFSNRKGNYINQFFFDPYNYLLVLSFISSILSLIFPDIFSFLKGIETCRILEIAKYMKSLDIILRSLVKSIPTLINLIIFSFIIYIFLALIPLKYLKGTYSICTNLDDNYLKLVYLRSDCLDYGGDWIN